MKRSPPSLSSSSTSTGREMALDDYESLNSITTLDTQSSDSSDIRVAGRGKGREMEMTELTPTFIGREKSPTPSMLMRRRTEEESLRNGQTERKRFEEARSGSVNRGKGGEKKDGVKRRHSSNEHANVYTECGRHSDDWLFGGFSITDAVKKIWHKDGKDSG
ncbi:uncharacterized protein EAE98_011854 [Botrytis deweyae]|uniref:Uncharacterized protein n=2 Tax=Botrytis TaxID=33196 RepID=A0A4Z1JWH0_9HELO|nr:uncharacterized protein EAE98_011854 [Botrytis deweyae]KAF7911739.1 hypothetical protein EAE98_011854 [Botrytis deweyae]KAF7915273.1 hypothetical protein EAE99_010265 [Botrytis elliptica]TGO77858.1 hypothetical protein BELL_0088g00120 [Botrytis elliptica]